MHFGGFSLRFSLAHDNVAKGNLLHYKRIPFTMRKATYCRLKSRRLNPNRSLELRRIMYLWQTVFLPFCRRRSGLRRDETEEKTAAEGHKTARSNNKIIEIKTLRSNDRFGLIVCVLPIALQKATNRLAKRGLLHAKRAHIAARYVPFCKVVCLCSCCVTCRQRCLYTSCRRVS